MIDPDVLRVTELGIEKRCRKCREYWPLDGEFWHILKRGIGGFNSVCRACRIQGLYVSHINEAEVTAMLRAGRSVQDIAETLGCSVGAIYKRQRAYRERAA